MPLRKGTAKHIISHNIHEMEKAGHPHAQAVAAALNTAFPNRKKSKGVKNGKASH